MKKKIAVSMIACMVLVSFTACGQEAKNATQGNSVDNDLNESETNDDNSVVNEFCGLSFKIPSDAEFTEEDSSATIVFEPQKRIAVIAPTDTSEMDIALKDTWNALAISSNLSSYDDVQNREDYELTIDGVPAAGATAIIDLADSQYSYSIVSVVNDDANYQYSISYLVDGSASDDSSDYEAFIESITLE